MKKSVIAVFFSFGCCTLLATTHVWQSLESASSAADVTIAEDTVLSSDMTVDGTLFFKNGAALDLNGYNLTVRALSAGQEAEDGIVPLEYVQSDGHQWLNTGYTPAFSDRIEMKFEVFDTVPGSGKNWLVLFCSRGAADSPHPYLGAVRIDDMLRFRLDHWGAESPDSSIKVFRFYTGRPYTVRIDGADGNCTITDEETAGERQVTMSVSADGYVSPGPFCILGGHNSGADLDSLKGESLDYIPKCKVYSFKVTDADGVVKLDLVPVCRTAAGVSECGMYDNVGKRFIGNNGTGSLGGGFGRVMNTASTASELRLDVEAEAETAISDVTVSGNIRLVKDGNGTLALKKAGQTYDGGTTVAAGTVKVEGNGREMLFGVEKEILVNGNFDEGQASGSAWGSYADATGFSCPGWELSNPGFSGLANNNGTWVGKSLDVGEYALIMKTCDTDSKGHSGDISATQSGLHLVPGKYRVSCLYTTRYNANHAPATNRVNLVRGNITNEIGLITVEYAGRTTLATAEFPVDVEEEGEYALQFLQTIADNGPAERTVILDDIVMERTDVTSVVRVEEGGTFEFADGARGFYGCHFALAGGTVRNSSDAGAENPLVASVSLSADSHWEQAASGGFVGEYLSQETRLYLGGHSLSVDAATLTEFTFRNAVISSGTLVLGENLVVRSEGSGITAGNAVFDVSNLFDLNAPLVVGDYVARRADAQTASAPAEYLTVKGKLVPVGSVVSLACTMADGSSLDFTQAESGLLVADADAVRFEENAQVSVRISGRDPWKLLRWTGTDGVAPGNVATVTFSDSPDSIGVFRKTADGLFVVRGTTIVLR